MRHWPFSGRKLPKMEKKINVNASLAFFSGREIVKMGKKSALMRHWPFSGRKFPKMGKKLA